MTKFTPLDPKLILELLEGQKDILTPKINAEEKSFSSAKCPSCGAGEPSIEIDAKNPFSRGKLLPNKILKCTSCSTEFDPVTGRKL